MHFYIIAGTRKRRRCTFIDRVTRQGYCGHNISLTADGNIFDEYTRLHKSSMKLWPMFPETINEWYIQVAGPVQIPSGARCHAQAHPLWDL